MGIGNSRIKTNAVYFPKGYSDNMETAVYSFEEAMKAMVPLRQYEAIIGGETGYFRIVKIGNNLYKYNDTVKNFCRKLGAIDNSSVKSSGIEILNGNGFLEKLSKELIEKGFKEPTKKSGISVSRKSGGITFTFVREKDAKKIEGAKWRQLVVISNYNPETKATPEIMVTLEYVVGGNTFASQDVKKAEVNGTPVFTADFASQYSRYRWGYNSDELINNVEKTFKKYDLEDNDTDKILSFVDSAWKYMDSIDDVFTIDTSVEFGITDNILRYYYNPTSEVLEQIDVPDGVKAVSDGVFTGTNVRVVTLPKTCTSIGRRAFCENLTLVEVKFREEPSSLTIGDQAFSRCAMSKFEFPSCDVAIGRGSFERCMNLSGLFVPNNVTSVGSEGLELASQYDYGADIAEDEKVHIYIQAPRQPSTWQSPFGWNYKEDRVGNRLVVHWGATKGTNESLETEDNVDDIDFEPSNDDSDWVYEVPKEKYRKLYDMLCVGADDGRYDYILSPVVDSIVIMYDLDHAMEEFGDEEEAREFPFKIVVNDLDDFEPCHVNRQFIDELREGTLGENLDEGTALKDILKKTAKKHARTNKKGAQGWFVNYNAGDVEHNIAFFNHAMGNDAPAGGCEGCGEGGAALAEDAEDEISDLEFERPYKFIFSPSNKFTRMSYKYDDDTNTRKRLFYSKVPEICMKVSRDTYKDEPLLRKRKNREVLLGVKKFFDEHPSAKYCIIECMDTTRHDAYVNVYRALMEAKEAEEAGIDEDIEKHDTLNPTLFDGNALKPDVTEAINNIVNTFVDELKEDGVNIAVKDIVLVGSNVSYNYTKDSDVDVHIIADSTKLECPKELTDKLYGAYRSIFNKNYDINFFGIPVEIFVELDNLDGLRSNGIYSVKDGKWIKEPEQADIPDLDEESFDKEFTEWEDKYFALKDSNPTSQDVNEFITDIYDLRKSSIASDGEYGLGNLIFKEFRNLGYLDDLKDSRKACLSKELSLGRLGEELDMDEITHDKLNALKDKLPEDGTYSLKDGKVSKEEFDDGFFVSYFRPEITDEDIAAVRSTVGAKLGVEYLGVYGEPEISYHLEDGQLAMNLARLFNQYSIWDVKNGTEVVNPDFDEDATVNYEHALEGLKTLLKEIKE